MTPAREREIRDEIANRYAAQLCAVHDLMPGLDVVATMFRCALLEYETERLAYEVEAAPVDTALAEGVNP